MLKQNAISSKALTSKSASFTTETGSVGLSTSNLADSALSELELLRDAGEMRHSELTVGHHARQPFLNKLEMGDRLAKLDTLHAVFYSSLVRADRTASSSPSYHEARGLENLVCTSAKIFGVSQLILVRHKNVSEGNISVLSDSKAKLALHFLANHTRGALLNNKSLNSATIILIAGPDDHVAKSSIADPPLSPIENPATLDFAGICPQCGSITSICGLSQTEAENLLKGDALG